MKATVLFKGHIGKLYEMTKLNLLKN